MFKCGTQRHRTSLKLSLWALKPNDECYTLVCDSKDVENNKLNFLKFYPNSVFKLAKRQPSNK